MDKLQHLKNTLAPLRYFLKKGSIDAQLAADIKANLPQVIPFICTPVFEYPFPKIQRVTVNRRLPENNNERINDTKWLKAPPADKVTKNSRAGFAGQSVFYSTLDPITALAEMKPRLGDRITVSHWESTSMLLIAPLFMITSGNNGNSHNRLSLDFYSIYERAQHNHPPHALPLIEEMIMFMTECFAKDVEYGSDSDYILSSWFADRIFNDFEDGRVEAIPYPSVQQGLGMTNVAIKPEVVEKKYQLISVQESIVIGEPGQFARGYMLKGTNETKEFDGSIIRWKDQDMI